MTTTQTIDGVLVSRELLQKWLDDIGPSKHVTQYAALKRDELRALLDASAPPSGAIGHIEQRRSMGLAIGSPITNVIWELPPPELQHLPDGAKVYLHQAAQPQGDTVTFPRELSDELAELIAEKARVCGGGAFDIWEAICEQFGGPVEQPAPVAVVHPFAEKVIRKLERFQECTDDGQGADIGRHWFDLLTQLGLLNRVQRSPALWEMTQQGEDALELSREIAKSR